MKRHTLLAGCAALALSVAAAAQSTGSTSSQQGSTSTSQQGTSTTGSQTPSSNQSGPGAGSATGSDTTSEQGNYGTRATMGAESTSRSAGQLHQGDRLFLETVAQEDRGEIELSKLAQQKAQNPQVKQIAQQMISDHRNNSQMLQQLAQQKGISPPQQPTEHQRKLEAALQNASGADFDKMYMKHLVVNHTKNVEDFRLMQQVGKDPAIRTFASQQLPTLQQHLQQAQSVMAQLK